MSTSHKDVITETTGFHVPQELLIDLLVKIRMSSGLGPTVLLSNIKSILEEKPAVLTPHDNERLTIQQFNITIKFHTQEKTISFIKHECNNRKIITCLDPLYTDTDPESDISFSIEHLLPNILTALSRQEDNITIVQFAVVLIVGKTRTHINHLVIKKTPEEHFIATIVDSTINPVGITVPINSGIFKIYESFSQAVPTWLKDTLGERPSLQSMLSNIFHSYLKLNESEIKLSSPLFTGKQSLFFDKRCGLFVAYNLIALVNQTVLRQINQLGRVPAPQLELSTFLDLVSNSTHDYLNFLCKSVHAHVIRTSDQEAIPVQAQRKQVIRFRIESAATTSPSGSDPTEHAGAAGAAGAGAGTGSNTSVDDAAGKLVSASSPTKQEDVFYVVPF